MITQNANAEKANALTGIPVAATTGGEGIDSSIHQKSGANPMVSQNPICAIVNALAKHERRHEEVVNNRITADVNESGGLFVPFVLATNAEGGPARIVMSLDISVYESHLMPQWHADFFAPSIVEVLLGIVKSSGDSGDLGMVQEYSREDAPEKLATSVISEIRHSGLWFDGAMGKDGFHEVWFAPAQLLPAIYVTRGCREADLRESMNIMEDSLYFSAIGPDDSMFDVEYPLAGGREKKLGYWSIKDWQGAFTESYRSAAADTEGADQFHEQSEKFIQLMTQRKVRNTRDLFGA